VSAKLFINEPPSLYWSDIVTHGVTINKIVMMAVRGIAGKFSSNLVAVGTGGGIGKNRLHSKEI
jgi:hypothetical protein